MKKSLSVKIIAAVTAVMFAIIAIIVITTALRTKLSVESEITSQLETVSKLNAQTAGDFLNGFADNAESVATILGGVEPMSRDSASRAYVSGFLGQSESAQSAWVEWELNECLGGYTKEELTEKFGMELDEEYNGCIDYYYLREDGEIVPCIEYDSGYLEYDYYIEAKEKNAVHITVPYTDEYTNIIMISAIAPIKDADGNFKGAAGIDLDGTSLANLEFGTGDCKTGFAYLISSNGLIITDTKNPELIGMDVSELDDLSEYVLFTQPVSLTGGDKWTAVTAVKKSEISEIVIEEVIPMCVIGVVGIILMMFAVLLIVRKLLKPIEGLTEAADEIAKGNLSVNIRHTSDDELGSLADSLRKSVDSLYVCVNEIDESMKKMTDGNFNIALNREFSGDFESIGNSISSFTVGISDTLEKIVDVAKRVYDVALRVQASSQSVSDGAEKQAGTVSNLTVSIEKISTQIENNSENSDMAAQMANAASASVENSNNQMRKLMQAMEDIHARSEEIGKINRTIEDIAFQTNILALNAAVEAARAGSSGKGFAVVADEVRTLATKSSEAARTTTQLIEASAASVGFGMKLVGQTAAELEKVVTDTSHTAEVVTKINQANAMQVELIKGVRKDLEEISTVVSANSTESEESARTGRELCEQAGELKELVAGFSLKN